VEPSSKGRWREGNLPVIGPRTHGLWLRSSVFDGARAFEGVAPALDRHCARIKPAIRSFSTSNISPRRRRSSGSTTACSYLGLYTRVHRGYTGVRLRGKARSLTWNERSPLRRGAARRQPRTALPRYSDGPFSARRQGSAADVKGAHGVLGWPEGAMPGLVVMGRVKVRRLSVRCLTDRQAGDVADP